MPQESTAFASLSYASRVENFTNKTARSLLELMERKKTNLCLSIDLTTCEEVLRFADQIGPYICVLKTHVDVISDFTSDFVVKLQELAKQHDFLLFEDRKFADIGNTVMLQYSSGVYKIASWADVTNCHIIPGEGIITGLATVGQPLDRGLLLLANMSSKGSLSNSEYTNKNVEYAKKYSDFVFGFIGDQRFCPDVDFITMTPGVSLTSTGDTMGQCYRTPELIIKERGCDVIIVGRGIYSAKNPVEEAIRYRDAGWNCYLSRLSAEK